MKTKFLPFLAVCLMCVALFSGCSNISYTFIQQNDGTITENFSVTISQNVLTEIDCNQFSQKIKSCADWWVTENADHLATHGVSCDGAKLEAENGVYQVYISIVYQNSTAYNNAWKSSDDDDDATPVFERGWFYDKYIIYKGKTEFANAMSGHIATELTSWLETNYPTYNWQEKLGQINGNYTRIYPSQIAPQTDERGFTVQIPGYTYLIWNFNMEKPDFEITMFKYVVTGNNRGNWLVTALIITAVCGIILFFALRSRKRKSPQQVIAETLAKQEEESNQQNAFKSKEEQTMFFGLTGIENPAELNRQNEESPEVQPASTVQNDEHTSLDEQDKKAEELQSLIEAPKKVRAKPRNQNPEKQNEDNLKDLDKNDK